MEKTKVVSVRLPESLVNKLDEVVKAHKYWKRNSAIEQALTAFAYAADHNTQYDILRWWRHRSKERVLTFKEVTPSEQD